MMSFLRSILALLLGRSQATKPNVKSTTNKKKKLFVTYSDWAMGRDKEYPPSNKIKANAALLIMKVNVLLERLDNNGVGFYGVASGYRPGRHNVAAGGARRSAHLTGEAIDLRDRRDQEVAKYLQSHPMLLEEHGLYMEHPDYTKGKYTPWVHLQIRPTKKRIFIPY